MTAASIYRAREREATAVPISAVLRGGEIDIRPEVQGRGFFDIRFRSGKLILTAGKFIGLVPLNDDVVVEIEPKMPASNLLHVLERTRGELVELESSERGYRLTTTRPQSVLDTIGFAFAESLKRIEVEGLTKQYLPFEASGSELRGRVNFGASVQRYWARGTRHAAVSSYFDLSTNTPANRLIRYACHVLIENNAALRRCPGYLSTLAALDELLSRASVELERPAAADLRGEEELMSPNYRRCVSLARAVLTGQGVELPSGGSDLFLPSLVLDMETLFENYIRRVLAEQLSGYRVLDGNVDGARPLFEDRREPAANPDVVIRDARDEAAIGEVKYKSEENRYDLNQVLAYSLAYRSRTLVLFLPADSPQACGLSLVGKTREAQVYRYRFDLSAESIAAEEVRMIQAVGSLLSEQGMQPTAEAPAGYATQLMR